MFSDQDSDFWGSSYESSYSDSSFSVDSLYNGLDMSDYSSSSYDSSFDTSFSSGFDSGFDSSLGSGSGSGSDFGSGWGSELYDVGGSVNSGSSFDFNSASDIYGSSAGTYTGSIDTNTLETVTVTAPRINDTSFDLTGIDLTQHVFDVGQPTDITGGAEIPQPTDGGTTKHTVVVDGEEREYFLHLPKGADPSKPIPLIIAYNGVNTNDVQLGGLELKGGEHMEAFSRLSEKADKEGFAVAYMQGNEDKNYTWNNGEWAFSNKNDIDYTKATLSDITQSQTVDSSRIYAVGFSQGESFVHTIANDPEMRDTFAAIGVVGGWMTGSEQIAGQDGSADPLSIISIHSEADPTVPINGAWQSFFAAPFARMESENKEESYYRSRNDITAEPTFEQITGANGNLLGTTFHSMNDNTGEEVEMVTLKDLGHVWPGGLGGESEVNATDRIWEFFDRHVNENPPDLSTMELPTSASPIDNTANQITNLDGAFDFGSYGNIYADFYGGGYVANANPTIADTSASAPIEQPVVINETGTLVEIPQLVEMPQPVAATPEVTVEQPVPDSDTKGNLFSNPFRSFSVRPGKGQGRVREY